MIGNEKKNPEKPGNYGNYGNRNNKTNTTGVAKIDFPVRCSIELSGSVENFDFDVMLVTDQG